MFCPACGGEYRPGFSQCADCGVPLVAEPPAALGLAEEDPHDLVPVLESRDPSVLGAAAARLEAMGIVHATGGPPLVPGEDRRRLEQPRQILVARSRAGEAERCLTDVQESVEAQRRDLERHGFRARGDDDGGEEDEAAASRSVLYCPRCASEHRGLSRCVDCGERLVSQRPLHAEAEPVELFATLDVEQLAAARRALVDAGIPFEWGRLTPADGARRDEPPPSPLIAAGWIQVPAARENDARLALERLPGLLAWDEGGEELGDELDDDLGDDFAGELAGPEDGAAAPAMDGLAGDEPTLYCPRCRGEYRAGFTRCADCDVPLVRVLPAPPGSAASRPRLKGEASRYSCASCGAPLASVDAVCPHCSPPDEPEEWDPAPGF
jgi:hypothetical protein